jgi:hypothetical protein
MYMHHIFIFQEIEIPHFEKYKGRFEDLENITVLNIFV